MCVGDWSSDVCSSDLEQLHFHFSLSCIGEGSGNPLQCSCLENPRDGGLWWTSVYGVAQSRTWLTRLSSSSSRQHIKKQRLLCQQRSIWSKLWFLQYSCMVVRLGPRRRLSTEELMLLNCGVGEDSWESLGLQGDPTSPFWRRSALRFLWKEWCWSWNSSTLATSCEELTHWKRLWWWEGLGAGGEGDDRGWDGWMASPTRWTWVWVNSRSWWWTGRSGVLQFMGSQRVGHDWATELNGTSI